MSDVKRFIVLRDDQGRDHGIVDVLTDGNFRAWHRQGRRHTLLTKTGGGWLFNRLEDAISRVESYCCFPIVRPRWV